MRIREALAALEPKITAGDLSWLDELEEIATWPVEAGFSRCDATMRIELMRTHAASFRGDLAAAQGHLDLARAALEEQKPLAEDLARWNDQLWSLLLNQVQLHQYRGEMAQADSVLVEMIELSPHTLEPARRDAVALIQRGALALHRHDYQLAALCYQEAVDACRALGDMPALLSAFMGLAQAQTFLGQFAEARHNAARARGLAGANAEAAASLDQIEAMINLWESGDSSAIEAVATADWERIGALQRDALRSWRGPALNATGQHSEAIEVAWQDIERTPEHEKYGAWVRYGLVCQDASLALADPELHHTALQALKEAYGLVEPDSLQALRIVVTSVDYINQWHPEITATGMAVLTACLAAIRDALRSLTAIADGQFTPAQRRAFAEHQARRAAEVAFDIAFRIGAVDQLSELIGAEAHRWRPPSAMRS